MDILDAEWNTLRHLALNIHKDSLSTASNNKASINSAQAEGKEDKTVHQLKESTDIE